MFWKKQISSHRGRCQGELAARAHYLATPVFETIPAVWTLPMDYIERNTMISGQTGHLYTMKWPEQLGGPPKLQMFGFRSKSQDLTSFADFEKIETFEHHATLTDVARKTWVFFEFSGVANAEAVSTQLALLDSELVGVGHIADDQMTAFCRRKPTRNLVLPEDIVVGKILTLDLRAGGSFSLTAERTIRAVRTWVSLCRLIHVNFNIQSLGPPPVVEPMVVESPMTFREVLAECNALSNKDLAIQFGEAHIKSSKKRSHREAALVSTKSDILSARRADSEGVSPIRFDAGGDHFNIRSLVPAPSLLKLRSYNVLTGAIVEVSLRDWITGLFGQRSLVIHGNAQCAKTPVARALCALLATGLQAGNGKPPFYLKVGTVDSLRVAAAAGWMQMNVPILFDEVTPDAPRGTRAPMGIECVKHITESASSSTVDGRNSDITIHCPQPKVFTSNAASPHEWFQQLPPDIFVQTDAQRLALHANVAAVFKRCFFLHVTECLIPPEICAAFETERLAGFNAQMSAFLGPELP